MSNDLYVFDDDTSASSSSYDPKREYDKFISTYGQQLTPANIKCFLLHARTAKARLSKDPAERRTLTFGTWKVEVVNNHYRRAAPITVQDHDLTLHRLSGYIALYCLQASVENAQSFERIRSTVINPISESMGINWQHGAMMYLSTLPGAEMFLTEFQLLPLAFAVVRVKKNLASPETVKKVLRQRYEGRLPGEWMNSELEKVKAAITRVESLHKTFVGVTARMIEFFSALGINLDLRR
ncbi:structural nucleocapsid protein [Calchaqui virus]|uniref:Nucleoprotein n=1 Tax=Calchaqui virus TaxID=1552845 RepID=A0A097C055_9VIRU|nr:structural nucleocapsid protein [Calchaqui virus]